MRNLNNLSPKLFVAKRLHLALALRAGVTIPYSDVVAATLYTVGTVLFVYGGEVIAGMTLDETGSVSRRYAIFH